MKKGYGKPWSAWMVLHDDGDRYSMHDTKADATDFRKQLSNPKEWRVAHVVEQLQNRKKKA